MNFPPAYWHQGPGGWHCIADKGHGGEHRYAGGNSIVVAEVTRLRSRVAELEAENARLRRIEGAAIELEERLSRAAKAQNDLSCALDSSFDPATLQGREP